MRVRREERVGALTPLPKDICARVWRLNDATADIIDAQLSLYFQQDHGLEDRLQEVDHSLKQPQLSFSKTICASNVDGPFHIRIAVGICQKLTLISS
ncbi:hypothetical protein GOP47_0001457 [Adiantum capillus-veneris]|uniref:Uncharacterized protein n=1 Tax=Adiantum capillus-veneris TaxID=13818 RepID=A0A9D4ZN93_ADICA|nr:hypothetical protein GOP47_0001457 [Adiantum capillus-veneris]